MSPRHTPKSALRRRIRLAVLASLAAGGIAAAQPAPLPVIEPPPQAAATEEAPPINVPTPAPLAVPAISEKEVAPAPPPPAAITKPAGVPIRRARYDVAVLEALDKVTAESLRFEAAVGRPVRYKSLIFTVKACERSAPDAAGIRPSGRRWNPGPVRPEPSARKRAR